MTVAAGDDTVGGHDALAKALHHLRDSDAVALRSATMSITTHGPKATTSGTKTVAISLLTERAAVACLAADQNTGPQP